VVREVVVYAEPCFGFLSALVRDQMGKIQNPILFSDYYGIAPNVFEKAELIDPFVDVDTPLFIDPTLVEKSKNLIISRDGSRQFRDHFGKIISLVDIHEKIGDPAWRAAERLLDFSEPPETGLGYGSSSRSGSSRSRELRVRVLNVISEIVRLGSKNPDMISIMAFLEEGVGPDTISDLTTNAMLDALCQVTFQFCVENGVPVLQSEISNNWKLPIYQKGNKKKPLVLVPRDIVKNLPMARDWSEVEKVILENEKIRDRVNQLLGGLAKTTVADRKRALQRAALEEKSSIEVIIGAVKKVSSPYDRARDLFSYYAMKDLLRANPAEFYTGAKYDIEKRPDDLKVLVLDTIAHFKKHVEDGNLWEELWDGDNPKLERSAQLIYYAIAEVYCKANNVDVSPEANMGGGPVDFKFSRGYKNKVLVEVKRSSGSIVHGYEKQLEFYKRAAAADDAVFLVIDFGDLGRKLAKISRIKAERTRLGEKASDIIVVDATKKRSASKR